VSKERAKNRADREREAAIRQAAKGHEAERVERQQSMKGSAGGIGEAITKPSHHHKPPRSAGASSGKGKGATKGGQGKGRPTPKQSHPRSPANKKRAAARVGRPDGPLARRRRFRIRLLVTVLLVVNVAVAAVWRDWPTSLAVLIVSVILAPLLAAALLRRK
jgi:hypothetical protein